MKKPKQLTLCVITRGDDTYLSDCLNDMKDIADEILVVKLGTEDCLSQLPKQAEVTEYCLDWKEDFSQLMNFCMDHALGEWILFLQADEMISLEQRKRIKPLLHNPNAEAYLLYVDYGSAKREFSSPVQFLRLLRNRQEYRFRFCSFACIPDENLYAVQSIGIHIQRRKNENADWQLQEQIRLLEKDLEENSENSYLRYMEGIEYLNKGKVEQSITPFEIARQTAKCGYLYVPHLYKCLAFSYLSLEQYDKAEEVLNKGISVFYDYNDLFILRAELLRRQGREREALKDLEICLDMRKHQSTFVPVPEIDNSVLTELEEEIKSAIKTKEEI